MAQTLELRPGHRTAGRHYAIDDSGRELASLERGSARRIMVMRSRPANIRVIHRRCRPADQLTGYRQRPPPDGSISRGRGWTC